MAYPHRRDGNKFALNNSFAQAFIYVGPHGVSFRSTTDEQIFAHHGKTRDGNTYTIVLLASVDDMEASVKPAGSISNIL